MFIIQSPNSCIPDVSPTAKPFLLQTDASAIGTGVAKPVRTMHRHLAKMETKDQNAVGPHALVHS